MHLVGLIHDSWGALEGRVNQGPIWNLKTRFSISVDGRTALKPKFICTTAATLSYTGQWGSHKVFFISLYKIANPTVTAITGIPINYNISVCFALEIDLTNIQS